MNYIIILLLILFVITLCSNNNTIDKVEGFSNKIYGYDNTTKFERPNYFYSIYPCDKRLRGLTWESRLPSLISAKYSYFDTPIKGFIDNRKNNARLVELPLHFRDYLTVPYNKFINQRICNYHSDTTQNIIPSYFTDITHGKLVSQIRGFNPIDLHIANYSDNSKISIENSLSY